MSLPFDFEKFRRRVVIWAIQTSGVLGYHAETAYLAINFVDRYLSRVRVIDRHNYAQNESVAFKDFQRLTVTALLMSAKLTEENRNPCAADFACFCDGKTTRGEIKRMEIEFSKVLNYQYRPVTPHRVIGEISAMIPALSSTLGDELIRTAYQYIATASIDYRALCFKPAILAVAALDRALADFYKVNPSISQHQSLSSFLPRTILAQLVKADMVSSRYCCYCYCYHLLILVV
ncbi:cyclin-like protein [Syncephalis fuscata]|nr:cyclin-like protein [Syncephalis fuscata]